MKTKLSILLATTLFLTACGDSRFNPLNWFRPAEPEAQAVVEEEVGARPEILDGRVMIARVTELHVDRHAGGAIIRAVGVPPTQGWFEAVLVPLNNEQPEGGVLSYEFRIMEPFGFELEGSERSREIYVARTLSEIDLLGVTRIRVISASNTLTARR